MMNGDLCQFVPQVALINGRQFARRVEELLECKFGFSPSRSCHRRLPFYIVI
jgi:hypothetical protein